MADLTLSIANGTPLGGQPVTITGAWSATPGAVTIDGRAATVTSWLANSVDILTPARRTVDNALIVGSDDVAVVLTPSVGAPLVGTYHYNATRLDLMLQYVRGYIGQISTARGDYYTITPAQITPIQRDQSSDTGADWPQALVYAMPTVYGEDREDFSGRYYGKTHCVAQAVLPLGQIVDWDAELRMLTADIFRAVMLARKSDPYGLNIAVTSTFPGRFTDEKEGAFGVATVEFDLELSHIATNMNTNTQGE
jgi:hypothetical protein